MGKLVSPEEMHEFLMSLPKDKLNKMSKEVKAHLNKSIKDNLKGK